MRQKKKKKKNYAESEIEHNYTDHNCHNCQDHQESDGSNTSSIQTMAEDNVEDVWKNMDSILEDNMDIWNNTSDILSRTENLLAEFIKKNGHAQTRNGYFVIIS